MKQPSSSPDSEAAVIIKATGIISIAAAFGVLLAYVFARFFGYEVTLIAILVTLFLSLSFESTVVEAIIPTILLAILGYMALHLFPQILTIGGAFSGIALTMVFSAYVEKEEG